MPARTRPTISMWQRGTGDYHTYRIPALTVTTSGAVLAFCEGRRDGGSDTGQIDLLLRRSLDEGQTWKSQLVVSAEPGFTTGNPAPVVDRRDGTIVLLFSRNPADRGETDICAGRAERTVWVTRSTDDGLTWSEPENITADVKMPDWTWYATGPGHGVQLDSGRLVIPCDHAVGVQMDRWQDPFRSHVVYSDDGGLTWSLGGVLPDGTNESTIAQLPDGQLYFNVRNHAGTHRRGYAFSYDGGESFGPLSWHPDLVEPACQGSVLAAPGGTLLFSNPASETRDHLTIRTSDDGGTTWSSGLLVTSDPAAYSDLAITPSGNLLCLYETGAESLYESLELLSVPLGDLVPAQTHGEVPDAHDE